MKRVTGNIRENEEADTAITHMIFFIAAVIIAVSVVAVLNTNVQSLTSSAYTNSNIMADQLRTDITIVNDPEIVPNNSNTYSFYVKNTGKTSIPIDYVDVFIDGLLVSPDDLNSRLQEEDGVWSPADLLILEISTSLSPGDHRILVAVENGKTDAINFETE
ncbi:flagellar protein G [Methanohalophilus portucalensis]|nr:flagellar protein G [Methanohalophilus portucalensis]OJH49590.1 flagellar protein G [Methanohalophilus portucalensis FDF-1]SMH35271.1 flagellar protein FlaG [Methanohalophilus portucalensis FDF-1]